MKSFKKCKIIREGLQRLKKKNFGKDFVLESYVR